MVARSNPFISTATDAPPRVPRVLEMLWRQGRLPVPPQLRGGGEVELVGRGAFAYVIPAEGWNAVYKLTHDITEAFLASVQQDGRLSPATNSILPRYLMDPIIHTEEGGAPMAVMLVEFMESPPRGWFSPRGSSSARKWFDHDVLLQFAGIDDPRRPMEQDEWTRRREGMRKLAKKPRFDAMFTPYSSPGARRRQGRSDVLDRLNHWGLSFAAHVSEAMQPAEIPRGCEREWQQATQIVKQLRPSISEPLPPGRFSLEDSPYLGRRPLWMVVHDLRDEEQEREMTLAAYLYFVLRCAQHPTLRPLGLGLESMYRQGLIACDVKVDNMGRKLHPDGTFTPALMDGGWTCPVKSTWEADWAGIGAYMPWPLEVERAAGIRPRR